MKPFRNGGNECPQKLSNKKIKEEKFKGSQ
jgi:hypothetical protein